MEEEADNEILLPVARAIAEGHRVDWEREMSSHPLERDLLGNLQALESLKAAHETTAGAARPDSPLPRHLEAAHRGREGSSGLSATTRARRETSRFRPGAILSGRYRIVTFVGLGGMGEVYRAHDLRLGRTVAIKLVAAHLSDNSEFRARLQREAHAVSQLSHPNICALYDSGEHEGLDFLVLEYLEGETLAARLTRQSFPLKQLWPVAIEIAEALSHAHRRGITHRDLKPSNIMLTKTGTKLLDFGLARVARAELTSFGSSGRPTGTSITATGTILGTLLYMAPEQLQGREVDARTDLWAFGLVLYEMVTGKRAFDGESQASVIGAIVSQEHTPITHLVPDTPLALERLVSACLAKDPDDRLQSAHDVRVQLEWIRGGDPQADVLARTVKRSTYRKRNALALAGAGALVAAALTLLPRLAWRPEQDTIRLSITPPSQIELTSRASALAGSPDGTRLAFLGISTIYRGTSVYYGYSIWIRSLESDNAGEIPGTYGAIRQVFWSPDGRSLGFFSYSKGGGGTLDKVALDGGNRTRLCQARTPLGGSWNARGDIILAPEAEGPIYRTTAGGGDLRPVTTLDSSRRETSHRFPFFLPDGDHFLFATLPPESTGYGICVGSLKTGRVKKFMNADSSPVYAPSGHLVFARAGKVMAQRFDIRRLELDGDPVTVTAAPQYSDLDAEPVASVSGNSRMFVLRNPRVRRNLLWRDRSGAPLDTLELPDGYWKAMRLSPDGRRACAVNDGYWVIDLARAVATLIASSPSEREAGAAWSPDGQRIAFSSSVSGRGEIYIASADGTGEPEMVPTDDAQFKIVYDWSSDGQHLVFGTLTTGAGWDLWVLPMGGGRRPELYYSTPAADAEARISPDGRWLAYSSHGGEESRQVFIQSFPKGGRAIRVSPDGGGRPKWSRGGEELIYGRLDDVMVVSLGPGQVPAGLPRVLFHDPRSAWEEITSNGERILSSIAVNEEHKDIRAILNWPALMNP